MNEPPHAGDGFRSGFVALAGRPNVGKSTLLNLVVGQTVAITTHRAQTTRRRIRGVVNRAGCQIVFVDTPGLHLPPGSRGARSRTLHGKALNRFMLDEARAALGEVDLIVLLIEATGRGADPSGHGEDRLVLDTVSASRCARLLAINKLDLLKDKRALLPIMDAYQRTGLFEELIPLSARTGEGTGPLLDAIVSRLPEGPAYFPPDMVTDEPERQLAAEFIREQVLLQAGQEVPYSAAVEVVGFEQAPGSDTCRIHADIHVERKSQKGILIGKGGARLKKIGTAARLAIERMLACKVYLDLRVRVRSGWSRDRAGLRRMGYRDT